VLAFPELRRHRDKTHLRFVARQPCLICARQPCDAHPLRFAQARGLGIRVSDEFTVPLCRGHHRELHRAAMKPIGGAEKVSTRSAPRGSSGLRRIRSETWQVR